MSPALWMVVVALLLGAIPAVWEFFHDEWEARNDDSIDWRDEL